AAAAQGYAARVVTTALSGEARDVAARIIADLRAAPPGTARIYGGETTVTLRGNGKGGRNQELALAAAIAFSERPSPGLTLASFGTDGTDGPTDAAGAWADASSLPRAAALGLDARSALTRNDSYPFFAALGDLILTGPTGTNVADVVVALRQV
ncbi:MAG: MOFRL family protein, partial [Thermoflexales bacterium]